MYISTAAAHGAAERMGFTGGEQEVAGVLRRLLREHGNVRDQPREWMASSEVPFNAVAYVSVFDWACGAICATAQHPLSLARMTVSVDPPPVAAMPAWLLAELVGIMPRACNWHAWHLARHESHPLTLSDQEALEDLRRRLAAQGLDSTPPEWVRRHESDLGYLPIRREGEVDPSACVVVRPNPGPRRTIHASSYRVTPSLRPPPRPVPGDLLAHLRALPLLLPAYALGPLLGKMPTPLSRRERGELAAALLENVEVSLIPPPERTADPLRFITTAWARIGDQPAAISARASERDGHLLLTELELHLTDRDHVRSLLPIGRRAVLACTRLPGHPSPAARHRYLGECRLLDLPSAPGGLGLRFSGAGLTALLCPAGRHLEVHAVQTPSSGELHPPAHLVQGTPLDSAVALLARYHLRIDRQALAPLLNLTAIEYQLGLAGETRERPSTARLAALLRPAFEHGRITHTPDGRLRLEAFLYGTPISAILTLSEDTLRLVALMPGTGSGER